MRKIIAVVYCLFFAAVVHAQAQSASFTLVDPSTGLEWQSDENDNGKMKWEWAKAYCENYEGGGKTGWRLPNIKELMTLVDYTQSNPSVKLKFETIRSSYYWSTTERVDHNVLAWGLNFKIGAVSSYKKTYASHVRCVRGK